MKVPKKSLILAGAALLCTGAATSAQKSGKGPVYRRVTEPLRPVTLNLETGTLTRGPRVHNKGLTTCSALNNNDFSGFVGVDTGPGGGANAPCEWWDTAKKSGGFWEQRVGGKSGLVTGFQFAYCSAALDPSSGGPGGTAIISFREGYAEGTAANSAGPSGTLMGAFLLTGLPANTGCSSFFGGFSCYLLTVGLGNIPMCFGGDGSSSSEPSVAWAFQFADLGTDGVLAKTFPFLSCVASCSDGPGSRSPMFPGIDVLDGTGMSEGVDQYCPAGTILSSFSFGTGSFGGYFTSVTMNVREAAISSQSNANLATAPNNFGKVGGLTTNQVPGLGVAPSFTIDCSAAGVNGPTIFIVGIEFPDPNPTATPSKFGTIWVPLPASQQLLKLNLGNHNQGMVNLNAPMGAPKDITLACIALSFQGFCADSPIGFVTTGQIGQANVAALK